MEHPDTIIEAHRGEWWRLDNDVEFRRRLIVGSPTDGWHGDEQLDLYYRDDPKVGRIWAIWQVWGPERHQRRRVVTFTGGMPGPQILRTLAARRVDRYDFAAELDKFNAAEDARRDAETAELEAELTDHARWMATSRNSPLVSEGLL